MSARDSLAYHCMLCNTNTFNKCDKCDEYTCKNCIKHVLNNIYICGHCGNVYVDVNIYDIDEILQTREERERDLCDEILRLKKINKHICTTNGELVNSLQKSQGEIKLLQNHIYYMPGGLEQIKLLNDFNQHKEQLELLND